MKPTVLNYLAEVDPTLQTLYSQLDLSTKPIEVSPQPPEHYFNNLCESIVSQQLSVKAADTIWARFLALLTEQKLSPEAVLGLSDEALRGVGLSRAKAVYIQALASAVQSGELDLVALPTLPDEEVIRKLTWVKGIGVWTAEMFMMFTLGREDIFSLGDLGLRNAVQRWYGSPEHELSLTEIKDHSQRWAPYRTYAARILWRSLELPKTVVLA